MSFEEKIEVLAQPRTQEYQNWEREKIQRTVKEVNTQQRRTLSSIMWNFRLRKPALLNHLSTNLFRVPQRANIRKSNSLQIAESINWN